MIGHRPEFHVAPATGWLNDPNGLVQWKGRHHAFHQFDPESFWFGRTRWGHFSSDDLVHWEAHPVALAPGNDGPDVDGVWSGCIVDDGGVATAVYTGVVSREDGGKTQSVCLARATDDSLEDWVKDASNPVAVPPPDFEVDAFRDPYVWRDGDGWAMLLGTGLPDGEGGVLLYRSADLHEWAYQGVLVGGADLPDGSPWAGAVWECPNIAFLPSGEALLMFSVHDPVTLSLHYSVVLVGNFDGVRFSVSSARRLDHGHDCYASAFERTADGRVLVYGWSWEALPQREREEQGWAGCLTVPRELGVRDGQLTLTPAREVRGRTSAELVHEPVIIAPETPFDLVVPRAVRIDARLRLDHTSAVRVAVRRSPQSGEELTIDYSGSRGTVVVDRDRSTTLRNARRGSSTAEYRLPADGTLELTIYLDHTIVEIYLGDTVVMTERVYPQAIDADHFRIEARTETFGEKPAAFALESLSVSAIVDGQDQDAEVRRLS